MHTNIDLQLPGTMFQRWLRILLLVVLGYEAAGAILGGSLLIARPDGSLMQMPVELMRGFFPDFLLPGIILFSLGLLNAVAFIAVIRRVRWDWLVSCLALGALAVWFVVEIIILKELHWLHLMWGFPVFLGIVLVIPVIVSRFPTNGIRKALLYCGAISTIWYTAINIYVPTQYDGYNMAVYTVSELSAIGAPTRILWVLLVMPYPVLYAAFGWGVLIAAGKSRSLRIAGWLIIGYAIFNFYWPPMHMRGTEPALTDVMHIVWAAITLVVMLLTMRFGADGSGRRFRMYTIATFTVFIVFGILLAAEAPGIPANLPTPHLGIWERINMGAFFLWVAVFGETLLLRHREGDTFTVQDRLVQTN